MTDRLFSLNDFTRAAGEALNLLTPDERFNTRRQVDIVLQGIIDRLKAPVVTYTQVTADTSVDAPRSLTADENAALHGYADPYVSPND